VKHSKEISLCIWKVPYFCSALLEGLYPTQRNEPKLSLCGGVWICHGATQMGQDRKVLGALWGYGMGIWI
jgi:hypothetical protein